MTEPFSSFPDTACKDAHPADTIQRIKQILSSRGIETKEQWNESGVPFCHSVHIQITGTPFGTNGKGVSRELALASGYGELMERLQIGYLVKTDVQKAAPAEDIPGKETIMELNALLSSGIFAQYTHIARQATGADLTEQVLLSQYADAQGTIPVTGYYSIISQKDVFLPTALRRSVYTTNGCAAGNTMEEAMVQAISEIVERHYKSRILAEKIPLPDIEEQTLQNCPIAWQIIQFLQENDFRVSVKDCSLGGKFPVVCVCLVDQRTGRYHTHFGAFPNFEIALQRTLTESFQGRNLSRIGQYEDFATDERALRCLMNELVHGTAEKSPEFFRTSSQRTAPAGFQGTDNRSLLKECLAFLTEQGLDIWVRDCSCLGFPTCQIIIPGYSEIFPHRLSPRHNDIRYAPTARKVMLHPGSAHPDEQMGLLIHLANSKSAGLGVGSFQGYANLSVELSAREDAFLMNTTLAYVHYSLGKITDGLKAIQNAISVAAEQDAQYLICLKRYLTLLQQGRTPEEIRDILSYFHRSVTIAQLFDLLEQKKNPLEPMVLSCSKECAPECRLVHQCRKHATDQIASLVSLKQSTLSQSSLKKLLQNLSFQQ